MSDELLVLEKQEKKELVSIVSDGKQEYYNVIRNICFLSEKEEKELILSMLDGNEKAEEARNKLIESYLPLVLKIAKSFCCQNQEFMDLVQFGNLGLINAVDHYDVTKETSFITYAYKVIRSTILRGKSNYEKHVSLRHQALILKYKRIYYLLEQESHRKPTIKEIADILEITEEEAKKIYNIQKDTISFDEMISAEEEIEEIVENFDYSVFSGPKKPEILDYFSFSSRTVEEKALYSVLQSEIETLFSYCPLKPREIEVLKLYYGLFGTVPMSSNEIGKRLGITRQGVHRIINVALNKIRKSIYTRKFADYMEDSDKALEYIDSFKK